MPYASSLARKAFTRQTKEILIICRQSSSRGNGLSSSGINLLYQAAIFKSSALLEEYIKDVISDWLYTAMKNGHTAKSLPEELKWFCIFSAHRTEYENFLQNRDESKVITNLKQKNQNKLLNDSTQLDGLISPNVIVGDRKYPSIKNIKRLFSRIGISNIFNRVDRRTHRNFELLLQSFLDVREAIAHQTSPSLTLIDTAAHIQNLQFFVGAIDRELFSLIHNHHGLSCWRTC